jgi:hypothetical protein
VEAEGLERSCKGEEEQGRREEDAEIEVNKADVFQDGVRRGH